MGNIAHRAGIESISLAFRASVLTITPNRLPDITTLQTPTCLCGCLPERSVQSTEVTVTLVRHCAERTAHIEPPIYPKVKAPLIIRVQRGNP